MPLRLSATQNSIFEADRHNGSSLANIIKTYRFPHLFRTLIALEEYNHIMASFLNEMKWSTVAVLYQDTENTKIAGAYYLFTYKQ